MKKVLLLTLAALAILSFFFFTPVLLLMLGLCCVGVGAVSMIHPERMSFDWFRHPSWIRAAGSVLFLVGSLASLAGGALTDQLYFKHQPRSTAEADTEWTTVGSVPSRPMTHPPSTGTGITGGNTNTQQQTVKERIKPSALSQNNMVEPTNTTTPDQPDQNGTSSSTSSTSSTPSKVPTDPLDFPGKKWDHPGNGHGNGPKDK